MVYWGLESGCETRRTMFQRGGGRARGFGFGGFSMRRGAPVPSGSWSRKHKREEDYFNESDSDEEGGVTEDEQRQRIALLYHSEEGMGQGGGGEEEDPLDAFMASVENEVRNQKEKDAKKSETKAVRDDIEEEDDQESYFKAMANAPIVVAEGEEELEVDYDSDGYPILPERSKVIDPLPPIDHSAIDYPSFERNFYEQHSEISVLSSAEVRDLRKKMGLRVTGFSPPKPCVSFAHFGFEEELLTLIRKSEFSQPTPIQSQAIPAALSGRDIIGIAKTGSGKTAAFLWPLLVHCIDQPEIKEGDGPIGLICAPTRELCQQIYHEAKKFGRAYNLTVCCVYGGGSKWEQSKAVKEGCEILVATPGRLIDLVKLKATNLQRVTYLVFDEADRMFDMGFELQVRSIANHVRPDRQTLLFSATFRKRVERLCRDTLTDPVRIVVGDVGEANTDITQIVEVMQDEQEKWQWLLKHLVEFTSAGSVLVFVTRKVNTEAVATSLRGEGHQVGLLHGDMSQGDRDDVITSFKRREFPVLVASDVAARGLDIPSIKTVINFDVAKDIDTHVHRIGRTGRAGEKGTAFTLVTSKDVNFAGDLVRNLEVADQRVPDELMKIAMQNPRFRKSRQRQGKEGGGKGREKGRGRSRARPGLGATPDTFSSASSSSLPSATGPMGTLVGPGGNRASVLKATMQAQYRMRFQASSSTSASSTSSLQPSSVPPPSANEDMPPPKKKRKSRWD